MAVTKNNKELPKREHHERVAKNSRESMTLVFVIERTELRMEQARLRYIHFF